jgi:DNA-binding SARP family transcriptional activator
MVATFEFGLLGPLLVLRDGAAVPLARGGQRALLAALLLNAGQLVTVSQLTEVLWEIDPPPSARASLHNQVQRLRAALGAAGGERISTQPGGYLIQVDAGELDLSQAEALLAAARAAARHGNWEQASQRASAGLLLWRGQPLADVDSEALAYEVSRLAELRLQLSETRLDAEVRAGRGAEAISELRRLSAARPLREQLHVLLMLALHRSGRRAEALAAYKAAREVLIKELGSEPAAELQQLHQQILRDTVPGPPAAADSGGTVPRQLPAPVRHFTGREKELAALSDLLDGGSAPSAMVISAIGGTAGVGKTKPRANTSNRYRRAA